MLQYVLNDAFFFLCCGRLYKLGEMERSRRGRNKILFHRENNLFLLNGVNEAILKTRNFQTGLGETIKA